MAEATPRKIIVYSQSEQFIKSLDVLTKKGQYSIISIPDIRMLFRKVYDEMPHLVIADVHLSDANTFDILSQTKLDIILSHIPLIVFTDSSKMGKSIDCGADLYLKKPIKEDELSYHVDRITSAVIHELDINPLTDLPGNRSSLQRAEAILKEKKPFAFCYVDIQGLNHYNQVYGVQRGDILIRETARILKKTVSEGFDHDTFVGHLGGDDFIILTSSDISSSLSEKVIESFDREVPKFYDEDDRARGYMTVAKKDGNYEHFPFVRLMIAIVTNEAIAYGKVLEMTRTAAQIHSHLRRFPSSAYLKDRRRNPRETMEGKENRDVTYRLIGKDMVGNESGERRKSPVNTDYVKEVHQILETGQIDVFLQPIVNMKNKRIFGYESLSWFPDKQGSYRNTSLVFQTAREADLIEELDILCAKKALANAVGLPKNQKLFLNLNRETLINPKYLEDILKDSLIAKEQVVFELTEQSLLGQMDRLLETRKVLRDRHIQLAVDDMGGGSVSLRETATLMPEFIKFDCSLIRDIDKDSTKQKILSSLLVFAKGINAFTTSEGIETKDEIKYLQRVGVDFGQGYFIAKPWKMGFASRENKEQVK